MERLRHKRQLKKGDALMKGVSTCQSISTKQNLKKLSMG